MKIYIDFSKQAITKIDSDVAYVGDVYSNVFELLFFNYGDNTDWFPTMSQLAPNGREAGDFSADALGGNETYNYVEDGVTYKRYKFTIGDGWVKMKGRSNFFIWVNKLVDSNALQRKCYGKVMVTLNESTDNYFIQDAYLNPKVKEYMDGLASDIEDELNDKVDAQNETIASLMQASPSVFDTASNITALTENKGVAVATDTGYIYYWDSTLSTPAYVSSGLQYNAPQINDGTITPQQTTFAQSAGRNVLDNSTVANDKIWKRQYGNPSTIYQATNNDGFCFAPINLLAGKKYYTTNVRFGNTYVLIGTWDSSTNAYTGTYYTIENCPFATYTTSSVTSFGTAIISPTDDCLLFVSSTTLQDIGNPSTAMVFEGQSLPNTFTPYNVYLNLVINGLLLQPKISNTLIVAKGGNVDCYNTIQSAIDDAVDGDTILVMAGEYYETVVCIDKEINIVGVSKEKCVLWYDSDNYVGGMPLSIAYGSVQNMTIKAVRATETTTSTNLPYAVHIDYNSQQNKTLKFDNVDMIGGWQSSCGIGLKGGFTLSFKNCNFISDRDTTNGALFFHDNTISGYNGTSNIIFDTCNIINKNGTIAIMPTSYGSTENTTNMKFLRTCIYSSLGGKTNACVGVGRAVIGSGWRQYNNFFLDGDSYGNNIELFNA